MARTSHRLAAIAIATGTAVLLAGCAGSAPASESEPGEVQSGGTLTVVRANPFEGFELDSETLNATFQLSQAVLAPLILPGDDGMSLKPGIAESWEYNDDNTALTITIDPRATFSDGEPVTAADVAFSITTWQEGPNYGSTYASIASTDIVDDQTIVLQLSAPNTSLPAYLTWANAGVVPEDFGGRTADAFWQEPIGAGPFVAESWSSTGDVVLTPNEHYTLTDGPFVDEVVSRYASDSNSAALQLRSGDVDVVAEMQPVTAESLPADLVVEGPSHVTPVLLMNSAVIPDASTRQAIGYAIDYEANVSTGLQGYGAVPEGALPPNSENWVATEGGYFSQDIARAQDLLGDADIPPLELVYANDASLALTAQLVQADLAEIGIDVELQAMDSGSSFSAMSTGEYDLALFSYNAISPDVSDPAQYVAATGMMFTGGPTDELWALLADYEAAPSADDKQALVADVQQLLFDEAPFVALANRGALTGVAPEVNGLNVMPWGVFDFSTIWKAQ